MGIFRKGGTMKPTEQLAEELWDKYSEYIDDNSSSFERVAGTSVIATQTEFKKAINEAISQMQPEWVAVDYDDDELELPLDFEQVLCLMTNGNYQVLHLLKYGINIVSWEWETVGLKPNKSFVIDDVVKWMNIPQPQTK